MAYHFQNSEHVVFFCSSLFFCSCAMRMHAIQCFQSLSNFQYGKKYEMSYKIFGKKRERNVSFRRALTINFIHYKFIYGIFIRQKL